MKKLSKFLVFALILTMLFSFTGCGDKEEEKAKTPEEQIVGSWKYQGMDYVYVFNKDGTGEYDANGTPFWEFTYTIDNGKIHLDIKDGSPMDSEYRIDGNKFIIKDSFGNEVEYVKQ